jgi:hypothetical protein
MARPATAANTHASVLVVYCLSLCCTAPYCRYGTTTATQRMPANRGIGRKHKAGTGVSKSQLAGRELSSTRLPGATPAPPKRSRAPKSSGLTLERPLKAPRLDVDPLRQNVRDAASELDAAVNVYEAAEVQLNEYHKKSRATMERLQKLRALPGVRSSSWTRGWQAALNSMDFEEERLALQWERQEAVVDAAKVRLDAAISMLEGATDVPLADAWSPEVPPAEVEQCVAMLLKDVETMSDEQLAA